MADLAAAALGPPPRPTGPTSSGQDVAWNNNDGDTAVFGGTAGTVTLSGTLTAAGLNFNASGYSLASGTLSPPAGGMT